MPSNDKMAKRVYTLPETKAVAKTMADEAKATAKVTNGGFNAKDIQGGLKAEASAANRGVRKQSTGVLGKKKKGWKRPGMRGLKGL